MQRIDELIEAATRVRRHAYVPYSHFRVGAALLGESGQIYAGCNVENISYGLTSCAERNAVFRGIGEGEQRFTALAVVTAADPPASPCGACRQVLLEFAAHGDMEVVLANLDGGRRLTRLSSLLPESFHDFSPSTE
jgi:cytidine deaminase